jgi:hypothetical protein
VLAADPSAFDNATPPLILAHRRATEEATLTSSWTMSPAISVSR